MRYLVAILACGLTAVSCSTMPDASDSSDISETNVRSGVDRPALSPEAALAAFQLEPGYRIDPVAAEPLVQDPVAIAFDERGRLYVAENRGYPDPLEGEPWPEPRGVIALLTDTNGDGRFDSRTDFATGLTYPNGIMVWDGGVFVTCAPDLLYLKDTTGDGVADERRVVLTGFNATRTAQIRFSHPTLALDNWIYLTSGLNGGRVVAPDRPEQPPVEFTSSDSRFDPRTQAFELVGGQGQYGLTFDDHGRRFICSNRHPVWHVVLEPGYLRRNPHLAFSDTVQEVSTVGADAVVWPISRDLTTASFMPNLLGTPHAGTFTSASGVHIHRGDALPDGHRNSVFICESAQNLVQRQVRESHGVSFRSRPARDGQEFLATADTWFSPVFSTNGPDGALYVVDMYRKDIDHPQYVPEASRGLFDFVAGRDRGRIYRIAAADRPPRALGVDLEAASPDTLVSALAHDNAWWRETAQRLLVERRSVEAGPALRTLARTSNVEMARLHAVWTLQGLDSVTDDDILHALRDESAGVRENAARLAETRVSTTPSLLTAVLGLSDDADPRVRLRAALALGAVNDRRAVTALAALARRDGADRWMRAAILSGIGGRAGPFLDAFLDAPAIAPAVRAAVMADLGQLFGAAEPVERCIDLIAAIADPSVELSWQPAALAGIARGLHRRHLTNQAGSPLLAALATDAPSAPLARERVRVLMDRARATAGLDDAPIDQRVAAIELLGYGAGDDTRMALLPLVAPGQPADVQVAAVAALGRLPDAVGVRHLLVTSRWSSYSPRTREAVLAMLLTEDRHVHALLDAIEDGRVAARTLNPGRRERLRSHRTDAIRERAGALLGTLDAAGPMAAYERLRPAVLAFTGRPASGAHLYTMHCVACHTFGGDGGRAGPDLSGIRNQPADAILLHILVPDHEITPGYDAYTVETRDGRSLFGRLESEAPNSITLRDATSQPHVILRADIVSMTAAPTSLMPAGFDEAMTAQDLADLIAYLKTPSEP